MSELRIDRLVQGATHRQLREFFLYSKPQPDTATALAISEPLPPDQSDGMDAADPAARLERCIDMQTKVVNFLADEQRRLRDAGSTAQPEAIGVSMLALLKNAIRHEITVVQDLRAQQSDIAALRAERD